jgi:hypothetical protein
VTHYAFTTAELQAPEVSDTFTSPSSLAVSRDAGTPTTPAELKVALTLRITPALLALADHTHRSQALKMQFTHKPDLSNA